MFERRSFLEVKTGESLLGTKQRQVGDVVRVGETPILRVVGIRLEVVEGEPLARLTVSAHAYR